MNVTWTVCIHGIPSKMHCWKCAEYPYISPIAINANEASTKREESHRAK